MAGSPLRRLTALLAASLLVAGSAVGITATASASTAPTVSSVSPTSGSTGGGTRVTVVGARFTGVSAVFFGYTRGSAIRVISSTKLLVTAPAHSAGRVNIRVRTSAGTSTVQSRDLYTFVPPPIVGAVSPHFGTTSGGTRITIGGAHFLNVIKVTVGGSAATHLAQSSSGSLTVTTPLHQPGTTDVRVVTRYGTSPVVPADKYVYQLPSSLSWTAPANVGTNDTTAPQNDTYVNSVSCPSAGFCAAVGSAVFAIGGYTRYPAVVFRENGTWSGPYIVNSMISLVGVSCLSPTFCVAVGQTATSSGSASASVILNSNAVDSWNSTVAETTHNLTSVSCASGPFCMAVDDGGNFMTYANGKWSPLQNSNTNAPFGYVDCTSSTFCMVTGGWTAYEYNHGVWTLSGAQVGDSVSCVSATFCMASGPNGESSFDGQNWSTPRADGVSPGTVSCTSHSFCVDVGNNTSYSMFNGTTWSQPMALPAIAQGAEIYSVSCDPVTQCVAVGNFTLLESR